MNLELFTHVFKFVSLLTGLLDDILLMLVHVYSKLFFFSSQNTL